MSKSPIMAPRPPNILASSGSRCSPAETKNSAAEAEVNVEANNTPASVAPRYPYVPRCVTRKSKMPNLNKIIAIAIDKIKPILNLNFFIIITQVQSFHRMYFHTAVQMQG